MISKDSCSLIVSCSSVFKKSAGENDPGLVKQVNSVCEDAASLVVARVKTAQRERIVGSTALSLLVIKMK